MPRCVSSILTTLKIRSSHLLHCQTTYIVMLGYMLWNHNRMALTVEIIFHSILWSNWKVKQLFRNFSPFPSLCLPFFLFLSFPLYNCNYFVGIMSTGLRIHHVLYFLNLFFPEKMLLMCYYINYIHLSA